MNKVLSANIKVHTSLIRSGAYESSPHRSAESKERLTGCLAKLNVQSESSPMHLDVGCGDGFVFECVPDDWTTFGADITPEMLLRCANKHPRAQLVNAPAENLPFEDSYFDVVTCYSFLDHLEDTRLFYSEALRLLKPGGYFYFGLSPNRDFYTKLGLCNDGYRSRLQEKLDLDLEVMKAFHDGEYYQKNFNIDPEDLQLSEPGKTRAGGLDPIEEIAALIKAGAGEVSLAYEWILQQNRLEPQHIDVLHAFLPFSGGCFKYFDLIGSKPW